MKRLMQKVRNRLDLRHPWRKVKAWAKDPRKPKRRLRRWRAVKWIAEWERKHSERKSRRRRRWARRRDLAETKIEKLRRKLRGDDKPVRDGIDVSSHQGAIDWGKAAKDAGFAFVKATEGGDWIDPRLERNIEHGERAFGWRLGYYHFGRPDNGNDPRDEARHFVRTVRAKGGKIGRNGVLDYEVSYSGDDTDWVRRWTDEYRALTGERPIIYGYHGSLKSLRHAFGCPLWLAAYTDSPDPWVPPAWKRAHIWQFTSSGRCKGIAGNVDKNKLFGDEGALRRLLT